MSTTTEPFRRLLRVLSVAAGIAALWVAASAVILAASEEAEAVSVILPSAALMNDLPDGVYVLGWDGAVALLKGTGNGYVAELYRRGAMLVVPARDATCLSLG